LKSFFGSDVPKRKKSVSKSTKKIKSVKEFPPPGSVKYNDYYFTGIKKSKSEGRKYDAIFVKENGKQKTVSFGKKDEKDFTQSKDKDAKEFYLYKLNKKGTDIKNLMSSAALETHILWDKPSLDSGLKSYKNKLKK